MKRGRKQNPELDPIVEMYEAGMSMRKISKATGKTHQAVSGILHARGVKMRLPACGYLAGRKPHGDVIVYEGRRYTWCTKGYWRCTCFHDRHNLARRIWEQNNGPIPHGWEVFYKDGNRYNLAIENLGCMSRSDRQTDRLKDQDYKAFACALATYARVTRKIKETIDPSLATARLRKVWETRRRNGNVSKSSKKAWDTRKTRYGTMGVKDPETARMNLSLSHMGKSRRS